ncbi:MAG TPA: glycine zipper 2TM domain-containing protein [Azospira sp.]|nr:glycine zipper 2TM domain-containing protein [Azospira sp.]
MEAATSPSSSASLLVKIAAISVTAVSLAGVGVLTGLLPMPGQESHPAATATVPPASSTATTPPLANGPTSTPTPAPAAVAQPATPGATASAPPAPAPAPKVHRRATPPATTAKHESSASPDSQGAYTEPARPSSTAAACRECGVIESVQEVDQKGEGTGLGAIAGGVLGGLLGSQIGAGHGKDVAAVAGAVGGAYAGHQVEKNVRSTKQYQVTVRLEDGSSRVFTESTMPGWRIGERVRVENGAIVAR